MDTKVYSETELSAYYSIDYRIKLSHLDNGVPSILIVVSKKKAPTRFLHHNNMG